MRFELGLFSVLSAALLAIPGVAAADFHFYQYATTCGGPILFSVYSAADSHCYTSGTACASVGVQNVPSGAKAQAYKNSASCSNYAAEGGAGYSCLGGATGNVRAANWFYPFKKLVRREEPVAPTRFSVTYELPDKTKREAEVPSGHLDRALKLVEANDYDALAEFPTFVKA